MFIFELGQDLSRSQEAGDRVNVYIQFFLKVKISCAKEI